MRNIVPIITGLILALGIFASGYFIANGLIHIRGGERSVLVRGLSEREVVADLAIWPVRYTVTGNDIGEAQERLNAQGLQVEAFLQHQGIPKASIEVERVDVIDLMAQQYRSDNAGNARYILSKTYNVRMNDVSLIAKAFRNVGDLIGQGIILTGQGGSQMQSPTYMFTKLNDVKPDMIAEATKNAREAAQKFAEDSGAKLGGIKSATQGLFQISPRDNSTGYISEAEVIDKRLRVVTTVEYYLR